VLQELLKPSQVKANVDQEDVPKVQKHILQVTQQDVSCILRGLLPLAAAKSMQQSGKDDNVRQ